MTASARRKPVVGMFKWYGGKHYCAKWVVGMFPPHSIYVEPFFGSGKVFFRKTPSRIEVINDINAEVTNYFEVLRDPESACELQRLLELTPYARDEFAAALGSKMAKKTERARNFMIRHCMGFAGKAKSPGHWGISRKISTPASFANKADLIPVAHERLRRTYIDNKDAKAVIRQWDGKETLFYLDPPYVHSTRKSTDDYDCEMNDSDHLALIELITGVRGMVIISGYENEMYHQLDDRGWEKRTRVAPLRCVNNAGRKRQTRTECVWINPAASARLKNAAIELPVEAITK